MIPRRHHKSELLEPFGGHMQCAAFYFFFFEDFKGGLGLLFAGDGHVLSDRPATTAAKRTT